MWGQGPRREEGHRGNLSVSLPPHETPVPGKPLLLLPEGFSEKSCPSSSGQGSIPLAFPGSGLKERKKCKISSPCSVAPWGAPSVPSPKDKHLQDPGMLLHAPKRSGFC